MMDLSFLRQLMGNDPSRIEKFLEIFRREVPRQLQELSQALESRNLDAVATIAHALKSQVRYFNAHTAADLALKIEEQAESGIYTLQMENDIEVLIRIFNELLDDPVFSMS